MKADWLRKYSYAHRGLHGPRTGHMENSQSAFNAAIEAGFGFELDVLLSRDDKAIVIHDETLDRLTAYRGNIIDLNSDELKNIKLIHSKDNIPTLEQVLDDTSGSVPILVEIKGDQQKHQRLANAVWQDIKNYKGDLAIMSFYPEIIKYFQKNYRHVPRGLVATSLDDGGLPRQYFDEVYQLDLVKKLDVDFIAYDIRALPNSVTEYCRANDIPVLTWTVRSAENRKNAMENTDGIIFELE